MDESSKEAPEWPEVIKVPAPKECQRPCRHHRKQGYTEALQEAAQ